MSSNYTEDEYTQREQSKRKTHRGRKVFLAALIILVVLGTAIAIAYRFLVVKPNLPPLEENGLPTSAPIDQDNIEDKVSGQRKSEDFYTILVVGTDTSSNSTDTMMLVSYDVTNQRATVMSIPRDTLVSTFGTDRYTRINSIYAAYGGGEEGMAALTYEVSELLGFMPDYRLFINWELVGQMVDAIGGVEYDVPYHMEYDDPFQDLHIYIEKGFQTLDGEHAMQLVRWRKNNAGVASGGTGSDLNRLQVQQGFLKATLKQTLQLKNVAKINQLASLFSQHVEGDLTMENLTWFATRAIFGGLDAGDVEFLTMPFLSANPYVYPDLDALVELVNTKLNPYATDVTVEQLDVIYFDAYGNIYSTGR